MKTKDDKSNLFRQQVIIEGENEVEGYPLYPENEDIYNKFKKEKSIDPEVISKIKEPVVKIGKSIMTVLLEDESGSDLDVPGSELDDEMEEIGSEDEENNYYSLSEEDENDLEEEK